MPSSFNASLNVQLNAASLNASSKQISQALGRITGQASEFQKSLDASTARVFAFGATTVVLNGVTQSFKKLVSTTIEVQKSLIEINSIFQATESTFNRFRNSIFQVAKETGQSFRTVAEGAAELARQGLSAEETAKRLKAALVLTRISGLDAEKSVKSLTAAINGFKSAGLSANQIVNKMVAVDTAFAVSAQDLADGFSRAGSTAEDAGVSFNELLALITAVEQKTARGGAVIGNAFKSIFTRLQRGTTIGKLQELGVAIDATQTGVQKLKALSNAIEGMSDPTVISQIKELAGGVFQINVVSAALKDLSAETGIFAEAAKVAASATNEAFQKNEALGESLAHNINKLVVGLTSLAEKVGTITFGPLLESLVGIADKLVGFLDKALDPEKGNSLIKGFFKGIGMFLSGPMVILFTAAFVKITKLVAKFAVEGMRSLFAMGTQSEKLRQIEGGIVGLLGKDVALRKVMESSTATLAQREQAVIAAIQRENALLAHQAQLMRTLATAAAARGVGGFNPATGMFGGRGGRRFNTGFRAEEAEAQMRGAPAGVRGKHSAGTIGGKKFIMNTHETEIPRFGRNGDSAVIPHYAGGFVPNYARPKPRAADIERGAYSQFFDGEGNARSQWMRDAMAAEEKVAGSSARGAALLARKKKAQAKRSYYANEGSRKTVMVIPKVAKYDKNLADHKFLKPHRSAKGQGLIDFFEGGIVGISRTLKGDEKFGKLVKMERTIEDNLTDAVNNTLSTLHVKTDMSTDPHTYDRKNVKKIMEKGGAGALGAIKGATFEALIQAITGGVAQDKGQLDIDFGRSEEKTKILNRIFGIKDFSYGDFKSSDSIDNKTKFAKQTIDNVKGKVGTTRKRIKRKNDRNRAAGFIPNFAGGGVPSSRIRVHRDSLGEPLAVTNTRDEPRGLQDAIKREKEGIGMFAGGFIPNYADFSATAIREMRDFGGGKAVRSQKALASATEKSTLALQKMETSGMGVWMAFGALQTGIGWVIASNEKRIAQAQTLSEKEIDKIKASDKDYFTKQKLIRQQEELIQTMKNQPPTLVKLAEAAQAAATALFAISALNMATGGALGKKVMGSKAGKGLGTFFAGSTAARGSARMATIARGGNMAMADKVAGRTQFGSKMGRMGGALAVGMGGFDIYNTLKDDQLSKHEKSKGVGKTVGEIGGVTAGAKVGGMIGTALAPATAGISVPVGVLVGAIAGGLAGGAIGKEIGGNISPKQKRLDMQESTAQAAFFGGEGAGAWNRRADFTFPQPSGDDVTRRFNIGDDVLHERLSAPILKKMGADIMANQGNVPFEALQGIVEEKAAEIETSVAKIREQKPKSEEYSKRVAQLDAAGEGGWYAKKMRKKAARLEKEIEESEAAIIKSNDELANARALMAGWNYKAHADQVAWEKRMKPAREELLVATQLYTKTMYDLTQAQGKRITAAIHQETAAKDEAFLVNALGKGPKGEAAKTMASMNVGEASLEVFRQKKDVAAQTAAAAHKDALFNTRDMMSGGLFETIKNIPKRKLAMDQMIDPKVAMADTTKKAFESSALKFGVSLKKTEADIAAKKIETQKKIEDLQLQTVNAMVSHVKTIYDQGGMDATMLEAQGTAMSGLAKRAVAGDLDEAGLQRLGQMVSEYDSQGTEFSAAEFSTFFGTSLEQWEIAMKKVTAAGWTGSEGDKQRLRGRQRMITDAEGNQVSQSFSEGVEQKKGLNREEDMNKLKDQEKALGAAMVAVTKKWENFAKDEDTKDIAEQIEDMQKAINEGEGTAEDINNQLKGVLKASESQAAFIEAQAEFANQAIESIQAQTARLRALESDVKRLKGETDVTPAAEVLTGGGS